MKYNWTKKQTKAIEASLEHWYENLMMLQLNKLAGIELDNGVYLGADHCALCQAYQTSNPISPTKPMCIGCPLEKSGNGCLKYDSPWRNVYREFVYSKYEILSYARFLKAVENMINALEDLLK